MAKVYQLWQRTNADNSDRWFMAEGLAVIQDGVSGVLYNRWQGREGNPDWIFEYDTERIKEWFASPEQAMCHRLEQAKDRHQRELEAIRAAVFAPVAVSPFNVREG